MRFGRHALGTHPEISYLAANDSTRAEDLAAAWCDPDTDVVWAARGGYGAQRMVDLVDYDRLRAAGPKWFVGFSDVTALLARLGRELGQVTLHGPGVGSLEQLADLGSAAQLRSLLSGSRPGPVLATGTTEAPGEASGMLLGGNLSLLAADVGVEPAPDRPFVLLVEDVGAQGYQIDRLLTQLLRSGWLTEMVGVVIGSLTARDGREVPGLTAVVAERLRALGQPVLAGAAVGHSTPNLALPLGAAVRLPCPPAGPATLVLAGS